MLTDFALDLRLARRKSGLSQQEVAHLLASDQSTLSVLENGTKPPSVRQIVQLSLIYGRTFNSLFDEQMREVKTEMLERLESLPKKKRSHIAMFNRTRSLRKLRERLMKSDHETS